MVGTEVRGSRGEIVQGEGTECTKAFMFVYSILRVGSIGLYTPKYFICVNKHEHLAS